MVRLSRRTRQARRPPARATLALAVVLAGLVPATAQAALGARTLRVGSRGLDVRELQGYLDTAGYPAAQTGFFSVWTARRVREFEADRRLRVNGIVETSQAGLIRAAANVLPSYGGTTQAPAPTTPGPAVTRTVAGARARLLADGTAAAPASAPLAVKRMIAAGNRIARAPYRWGGGHARWYDTGYDCSGTVAFALHGAGYFPGSRPAFGSFNDFGAPGPGRWVTLVMNSGHIYMVVAGLRFDTTGRAMTGSRWQTTGRPTAGWRIRHPHSL